MLLKLKTVKLKGILKNKIFLLTLVTIAVVFFTIILFISKKREEVLKQTLIENSQEESSIVLGAKTTGQFVFYDENGVVISTSLDENLKPQVDITVDNKTVSKPINSIGNPNKSIGGVTTFFSNGWEKFVELISAVLDQFVK